MSSRDLNNKLIRVDRTISIYNNSNNSLIEEININEIPVEVLKEIVKPKKDDPLLYDGYMLDEKQIEEFNKLLRSSIVPEFSSFFYVLESEGIYDWAKE